MDVEVWLYDLSRGLARQLSLQLVGQHFEYIPHTSLVIDGRIEYFFAGHGPGIHSVVPGTTHYGTPIEKRKLGKAEMDIDTIIELLDSLREVYHAGAYDLFEMNCNNFTSDFASLLGLDKQYPRSILDIPRQFQSTPMGRMIMGSMNGVPASGQPVNLNNGHSSHQSAPRSRHPHRSLNLPGFESKITRPLTFKKIPSLDKLAAKLEAVKDEDMIVRILDFIKRREAKGAEDAALPLLADYSAHMKGIRQVLPLQNRFALVDLIRIAAIDPRFAAWLVAEDGRLKSSLPDVQDWSDTPSALQITCLQLVANTFLSPITYTEVKQNKSLSVLLTNLISTCLLSANTTVRLTAASVLHNLASQNHNERLEGKADQIYISEMEGIEEAVVQAVVDEDKDKEALHGLLLALGTLLYCAPDDASIWDLCDAMELKTCLDLRAKGARFASEALLGDVITMLEHR